MKVLNVLFLALIFFATSCSDEVLISPNDNASTEARTYGPNNVVGPYEQFYKLAMRTGEWTETGCHYDTGINHVFRDYSSCACQKNYIISRLGENECYTVDKFCTKTAESPTSECSW